MSQQVAPISTIVSAAAGERPAKVKSFVHHAKLISGLTLVSRVLGVFRESLAARYFGAGLVSSAFTVAFMVPNLFRRLFGEGALSAAFIPLYAQSLKADEEAARKFAAGAVNLLIAILLTITAVGELVLLVIGLTVPMAADRLLALKLTAVMLPYVLLVCGQAFLGAILQVHRRFGMTAATPIVLNIALIASTVIGVRIWGEVGAVYFISVCVLLAGFVQVAMLLPSLRQIGFRFQWTSLWTPSLQRMLKLSVPVAIGAGVLQISVLIDRGISFLLAEGMDQSGRVITHFHLFGHAIRYPMVFGAAARLSWAQYLYQFPLGVFATALATAIFPALSADALEKDRAKFLGGLRRGIKVTIWEGLPASVGLILVAQPAVQLLFEHGKFTAADTALVAMSVRVYAIAIWAFGLQQILSRAYYALHDTWTPLVMSVVTLVVNCMVEIPLLWSMGEAGMAAGTTVSFSIQALVMLWMLRRKTGDMGMREIGGHTIKTALATLIMAAACIGVQHAGFFPKNAAKSTALARLAIITLAGGAVYGLVWLVISRLGRLGKQEPARAVHD